MGLIFDVFFLVDLEIMNLEKSKLILKKISMITFFFLHLAKDMQSLHHAKRICRRRQERKKQEGKDHPGVCELFFCSSPFSDAQKALMYLAVYENVKCAVSMPAAESGRRGLFFVWFGPVFIFPVASSSSLY